MSDPLIGKQLGDYVIQDLLGRGGMARVYKGYDERLQRYAAVKVINSDFATADQAEYAERFRREARAIARLHHPNIVGVFQFGEYESNYYMAMVFIEGQDLRQILKEYAENNQRMPHVDVLNIIRGIGSALDYAHSRGVIHRDIKPSNVMLDPENRAILTDFGLALSTQEGTLGDTFGSAHYIAPEQAVSSAKAVPQSDLYSLGVCLYEMLAGKVPFDDPSAMSVALKHLNDAPPPPRLFNPDLPPAVERVILKVLDKDPNNRYPSGALLTQALETAMLSDASEVTEKLPVGKRTDGSASQTPIEGNAHSAAARHNSDQVLAGASLPGPDPFDMAQTAIGDSTPMRSGMKPPSGSPQQNAGSGQSSRTAVPMILLVVLLLAGLGILFTTGIFSPKSGSLTPTGTIGQTAVAALTQQGTSSATDVAVVASTGVGTDAATVGTAAVPIGPGTQPPTQAATIAPTMTDTHTATPAPTTEQPTTAPILPATATATPTVALAETASASPTAGTTTGTAAGTPEAAGAGGMVSLNYDDYQLILTNTSNHAIDISKVKFVQRASSEADNRIFDTTLWDAPGLLNRPIALGPKFCYQVYRTDKPQPTPMPGCSIFPVNFRAAWAKVASGKWFWIPRDSSVTTFDVILDNKTLVTCSIAAGHCEFTLP